MHTDPCHFLCGWESRHISLSSPESQGQNGNEGARAHTCLRDPYRALASSMDVSESHKSGCCTPYSLFLGACVFCYVGRRWTTLLHAAKRASSQGPSLRLLPLLGTRMDTLQPAPKDVPTQHHQNKPTWTSLLVLSVLTQLAPRKGTITARTSQVVLLLKPLLKLIGPPACQHWILPLLGISALT